MTDITFDTNLTFHAFFITFISKGKGNMQQDQQKYLDYILENSDIFMERGYALPVENQLYSQVYVKKGVYLPLDCETPPVMHDSLEII